MRAGEALAKKAGSSRRRGISNAGPETAYRLLRYGKQ
jgi:riboflavin synthase